MLQNFLESRFGRPALYSALITFGMFWTLHLLIIGGRYVPEGGDSLSTVDFVRLKKQSELETRSRQKPPKPPPPKNPPPPPKVAIKTPAPTPNPFHPPIEDPSAP